MKTVLSFGHHSPSISPSPWRPLCLQKFLRVQVPLGCLKTAFVTQRLGNREFVKTMEVSIIFLLPERRKVSCRQYDIHSKANLLCSGYLSPNTWKKLLPTYYIYILPLNHKNGEYVVFHTRSTLPSRTVQTYPNMVNWLRLKHIQLASGGRP